MSLEDNHTKLPAAGGQVLAREGLAVDQLRQDVKGRVIAPGEAGYDEARELFTAGSTAGRR